jgi:hypothetical protein
LIVAPEPPFSNGTLNDNIPVELISHVWKYLPTRDLIAYGNTNGTNRIYVQDFIRRLINDEIRVFVDDPHEMQDLLWRTCSIISGSMALATLIPAYLRGWRPKDMDIYTVDSNIAKWMDYVVRQGYRLEKERVHKPNDYAHAGIREVMTFVNPPGFKIDIIITDYHSALTPIFKFYGTHVMNAITGRGIFCAYPNQTLRHRITLNGIASHSFPLAVQKALLKYSKRLFRVDINSIIATEIPHACHHSHVCPHTSRHSLDNGTLIIGYDSTRNIRHFVNNHMDHVFAGLWRSDWTLGGDPCHFDSVPLQLALSHISEVRRQSC